MPTKSKSNNQSKIEVCGNCGMDLLGKFFTMRRNDDGAKYFRCDLCTAVWIKKTETDIIDFLEKKLDQLNRDWELRLLIHQISQKGHVTVLIKDELPADDYFKHQKVEIKLAKYVIAYTRKLLDMYKTDLQELNYHKNKMSRQYLVALSRKQLEEAEELSEQSFMTQESYRILCKTIQSYLNQYDNIWESKIALAKR